MAVKNKKQIGLEDKIVSNSAVLELLMIRENMKGALHNYNEADRQAKAAIEAIEDSPPYRIGPFYIERNHRKGRHVEFDTQDKAGISITKIEEGE